MKRFLFLFVWFIIALTAPLLHATEVARPSGQVTILPETLVLNSYHPGYAFSDDEQAGVIDVFRAKDKNWVPVVEYLDMKRLPDGKHLAELRRLFRKKYRTRKFSVVIAMDNPALEFAIDSRAELFGNTPIVFCGINNYTPSLLKGRADVTGIVEAMDIAGTIEVMLRLHPDTREIFIPHDYTVSGLAVPKDLEPLLPRFGPKVRFRFTDPLTMEELLKELERLPKDSLVLAVTFITDKSGRTFGISETTKLFAEHSPVPIYATHEQRLGFGIVGGKLLSGRIQGTNAASIALRVLAGERASAIPVVSQSHSQFMFDYKVMSRFGIPLSALPEGSTVINKPVSFYAAHREVILTALGAIGVLAIIILLLTINIIQRRRSTIALRESEQRYHDLFDQANEGLLMMTPDGQLTEVNFAFAEMHGYTVDELKHEDIRELDVLKERTLEDRADIASRIRAGEVVRFEVEHCHKAGHIFPLSVTINMINLGGQVYFLAFHQDITERKRAEEALQESEIKLRSIFESSVDAIGVSKDGIQTFMNPAYLSLFGYSSIDELINQPVINRIAPSERETILEKIRSHAKGEVALSQYETRGRRKDGTEFDMDVHISVYEMAGEMYSLVILRDITDIKWAEEEKRALQERLQRAEKMEALGQLAGGVAHDLNNVLGVLSGYSELLIEKIPADNPLRKYAENIFKSTEKGAAIIQDLLTLARRGVVVSQVVDINSIVSNLLATMEFDRLKDYHPGVTFRADLEKDMLNIKGSPVHLEKTVMNLVSNAAEAIAGSGEVMIRTENRYLDKAVRGYDQVNEGDYVVLSVSDTGGGIPTADLNKIFEPFYTKKKMGRSGTGLGLAIVWGTVKDHEGYIDVQSAEGKGTNFTLYLPVTREKMADEAKKIPVGEYMGHGESVLVVDDVEGQRTVATALLMELGYQVHAVSSGEVAVEYLKENKVDILILDMIMDPGIDGLETYKRVQEINPKQKAIIVSGFSETDRVKEAQRLGAGTYVKKPYVIEKIGVAIRDELDKK